MDCGDYERIVVTAFVGSFVYCAVRLRVRVMHQMHDAHAMRIGDALRSAPIHQNVPKYKIR